MKPFCRILLIYIYLLLSIGLNAQVLTDFNATINVYSVTGSAPNYTIQGIVNNTTGQYSAANVAIGDIIYMSEAATCVRFQVTSVTAFGSAISATVTDVDGITAAFPLGIGMILRETDNFSFPLYVDGVADDLLACVRTHFTELVDQMPDADTDTIFYSLNSTVTRVLRNDTIPLPSFIDTTYSSGDTLFIVSGGDTSSVLVTVADTDTDSIYTNQNGVVTLVNRGDTITLPIDTDTDTDSLFALTDAGVILLTRGDTIPSLIEVDGDTTNELQNLSRSGDSVLIENGTGVDLSDLRDNTDTSGYNLTFIRSNDTLYITDGNGSIFAVLPADQVFDGDSSITNEIQTLTKSNDTIYLSGGGFVLDTDTDTDTDEQNLSRSGDSLLIERGSGVDLSDFRDNTDTSGYNLSLIIQNDSVIITDGAGTLKAALPPGTVDTDTDSIYFNDRTSVVLINRGDTITLPADLVFDGDSSVTNEIQQIDSAVLTGTTLTIYLQSGGSASVDLASIDTDTDTDEQNLSLSLDSLLIERGTGVDLSGYLDNTDDQNIDSVTFSGNILTVYIESGASASVDLSSISVVDTDSQSLSIVNDTLYISRGNFVRLNPYINTDTSGYNLTFEKVGDSLFITDGAGTLSVYIPDSVGGFPLPTDSITFNNNEIGPDQGELNWDQTIGFPVFGGVGGISIKLGQDALWLCENQTGSLIAKGTVVGVVGALGNSGKFLIAPFLADGNTDNDYLLGIAADDIPDGTDGYVMHQGKIRQIDLTAYPQGSILYASPTVAGALTTTEPANGFQKFPIAFVVDSSANGTLGVRVKTGEALRDLHDVDVSTPADRDLIAYDSALGYWVTVKDSIYDGDSSVTNELQTLSKSNDTIYLTDGGFVLDADIDSFYVTYYENTFNVARGDTIDLDSYNPAPDYPDGFVHCDSANITKVVDVVSTTGKVWMDRNLGASRVAQAFNDSESYGDLYQWGRFADGHQCRDSDTTLTNATTSVPNAGNTWDGKFILEPIYPYDWLTPQDDNLWQGVNGVNNPCPSGYRVPTEPEWQAEDDTFTPNNLTGAFASNLKITTAGFRSSSSGLIGGVGSTGFYWSSSVTLHLARALRLNSGDVYLYSGNRAYGFSVRCIKESDATGIYNPKNDSATAAVKLVRVDDYLDFDEGLLNIDATNTEIHMDAKLDLEDGNQNQHIGENAGKYISGGVVENLVPSNSIYIGTLTEAEADGQTNQIVIGYDATGNGSNTTTIGKGINEVYIDGIESSTIANAANVYVDASNRLWKSTTGAGVFDTIYASGSDLIFVTTTGDTSIVTITLSSDNWGTQVVISDATLDGDGTASPDELKIAQQGATDNQALKWDAALGTWKPADVTLSWSDGGGNDVITLSDGGGSVTITDDVNDADADASNELQTISKTGLTITLSNGGGTVQDSVIDDDADSTNEIQSLSWSAGTNGNDEISLSDGGGTVTIIDNVNDADADSTNEIQSLTFVNDTLTLSKANSVVIPDSFLSGGSVKTLVSEMVTSNTETLIDVTYDAGNQTLDFVVNNDLSQYDNSTSSFLSSEVDGSTTNEIQTIDTFNLINDTTLQISLSSDGETAKEVNLAAVRDGNDIPTDGQGIEVAPISGGSYPINLGTIDSLSNLFTNKRHINIDDYDLQINSNLGGLVIQHGSLVNSGLQLIDRFALSTIDFTSREINHQSISDDLTIRSSRDIVIDGNEVNIKGTTPTLPYVLTVQSDGLGINNSNPNVALDVFGDVEFTLGTGEYFDIDGLVQDDTDTRVLSIDALSNRVGWIDKSTLSAGTGTDDQIITDFSFGGDDLILSITIEDGNTDTADLSVLMDGDGLYDSGNEGQTIAVRNVGVFDSLKFDDSTFVIDAGNNRIGINTLSPVHALSLRGDVGIGSTQILSYPAGVDGTHIGTLILGNGGQSLSEIGGGANSQQNTLIGINAGFDLTTGYYNTALGYDALANETTGSRNTAIGYESGKAMNGGNQNTLLGFRSGLSMTTGYESTFFGVSAGNDMTTGFRNNLIGHESGRSLTDAQNNTMIGYRAGNNLTTGNFNTIIGNTAGSTTNTFTNATKIDQSVLIGYGTKAGPDTTTNSITIGYNVFGGGTNTITIGSGMASAKISGIYNNATALTGDLVRVASDGTLQRQTSSLRYKTDIREYTRGTADLLKLRPIWYRSTVDDTQTDFAGFIAEELHDSGLQEYVSYDENGLPSSIGYERLSVLLTKVAQEQQFEIQSLKEQINSQNQTIQSLIQRIEALENK